MGYRTFRSTPSSVRQPIQGLAQMVFRGLRRLGTYFVECVSKASSRAFDSEIFVRALEDFRGFVRATGQIVLLSPLRFSVWRDECVSCGNRGSIRATFSLWRERLRDLANSVLLLANWLLHGQAFRTTGRDDCATAWHISANRTSFDPARWVGSIAYRVLGLFPYSKTYPQNLVSARS